MGMFDGLLGGGGDIDLAGIAGKLGLSPDELRTGAESMLTKLASGNHDATSAAVATSAETGLPADTLQQLLPTLAAEFGHADVGGLLGTLSEKMGGLGGGLGGIANMAKGMFGK